MSQMQWSGLPLELGEESWPLGRLDVVESPQHTDSFGRNIEMRHQLITSTGPRTFGGPEDPR